MEETKTTLQRIIDQKKQQIKGAIEQAIEDGAELQKVTPDLCKIDGVMVWKNNNGANSVVLIFESPKIAKAFEPSKEDLAELADRKRKELAEIEQQLKERANE